MTEEDFRDKHKNDKLPEELKILIAKAAETGLKILKDYENEFNKILDSYQDYCRVNGLIVPKNTDEFFTWISLRYPYESLPVIIEAAKNPFNYKLFHDYKERLFKNPEWNDKKEMEFLQEHFGKPAELTTDSLSNLICHEKGSEIVENIKVRFKNIQGKRLKLLLIALQNLDLLPKDRIAAKFHRLCTAEFSWSIDSYNAMNKYKYNKLVDGNELHEMTEYLKTIIDK
jgi:hypothetical protein